MRCAERDLSLVKIRKIVVSTNRPAFRTHEVFCLPHEPLHAFEAAMRIRTYANPSSGGSRNPLVFCVHVNLDTGFRRYDGICCI